MNEDKFTPIPVNEPLLAGNEKKYLQECVNTGWISSEGPFVERFETEFAKRVGRKNGVAVANGTAALDVAVAALELGSGDEVILPTFTIISCASAILRSGATPVVVDADPMTWNMKVEEIEEKITPRTRAIMVVHIYGLPTDMSPVLQLADKYGLDVIEDAAEAIGQTYRGQECGSFGTISTFSFYPNKHVTTGEGGMVLTDNDMLAERCKSLRNLCFQKERRFVHNEIGWNYRMSNIQAAIGLAQLEQLDKHLEIKRHVGNRYAKALIDLAPDLQLPAAEMGHAENLYWVFGLVLRDQALPERAAIMKSLGEKQIGTRPFFWCMHEQPVLLKQGLFKGVSCPDAEILARNGFYLPSGLVLRDSDIDRVARCLIDVINESRTQGVARC
jgi:perosamine synthetase